MAVNTMTDLVAAEQKDTIDCILSIFETGRLPTKESYGTVALLPDGAGISYGKHQATDRSGALDSIISTYARLGGPRSLELSPFAGFIAANASCKLDSRERIQPDWYQRLTQILRDLGSDPVMQAAQDTVFAADYWAPAVKAGESAGCKYALSYAVLYDTCIHSGAGRIAYHRNRFPEKAPAGGGDEKAWLAAYLNEREKWLLASENPLVRRTIYRPQALRELLKAGNLDLARPLTVRGIAIK